MPDRFAMPEELLRPDIDPAEFVEKLCGVELQEWQRQILKAQFEKPKPRPLRATFNGSSPHVPPPPLGRP